MLEKLVKPGGLKMRREPSLFKTGGLKQAIEHCGKIHKPVRHE